MLNVSISFGFKITFRSKCPNTSTIARTTVSRDAESGIAQESSATKYGNWCRKFTTRDVVGNVSSIIDGLSEWRCTWWIRVKPQFAIKSLTIASLAQSPTWSATLRHPPRATIVTVTSANAPKSINRHPTWIIRP